MQAADQLRSHGSDGYSLYIANETRGDVAHCSVEFEQQHTEYGTYPKTDKAGFYILKSGACTAAEVGVRPPGPEPRP